MRRYMFERAEKLGMTVGRMMAEMTQSELVEWMALDTLRVKEREKAARAVARFTSKPEEPIMPYPEAELIATIRSWVEEARLEIAKVLISLQFRVAFHNHHQSR